MPPVMRTGLIDVFAFIGTNAAASAMIKDHPSPNRLRVCLGLDAKNPAFVLPSANLDLAVSEILLGALSFNGQRCTAIKIIFVHDSIKYTALPLPAPPHCIAQRSAAQRSVSRSLLTALTALCSAGALSRLSG